MLGHLADASMQLTDAADQADVIVVNTCGFIEEAKRESIDVILEMAQHKANGRARQLIVTGCLVQRYAKELAQDIPEIDALLGNGAYESVTEVAKAALTRPRPVSPEERGPPIIRVDPPK